MKPLLLDANIWLALLVPRHEHHAATMRWFEQLGSDQAGLCRIAHLSVIRLLGLRTIMAAEAIPAAEAWALMAKVSGDDRVSFLSEPSSLNSALPTLFRYRVPTPNIVMDAYLAAFAITTGRTLVTRDRGFLQFRDLDVELLGQ